MDQMANVAMSVLVNRYFNKGTAFTENERRDHGILGRLPPRVETLDQQLSRAMDQLDKFEKPIEKYVHLNSIHSSNVTLYYAILQTYPEKMLPIVYTPTVGEACQKFGSIFVRERGLYLATCYRQEFPACIEDSRYTDVDIIVVTDGSRILGLGDLGANGMGISVGKCALYVVGAGLRPRRVLPVLLDCGTNTESIRNDPYYLGQPIPRVNDETFFGCLDDFMATAAKKWPTAVIQFEDFSNNHCFDMLERYRNKYRCFNDDIQGTGAVVSSGFVSGMEASGIAPPKHRVVVFGAGSAAAGVVDSICKLVAYRTGVPEADVCKCFYLVDTKGLVTTTRGDELAAHKVRFARTEISAEESKKLTTLRDVVNFVKPTAFLGLGGVGPVLDKEMVNVMMSVTEKPLIFPLSNPTSKAECNPVEVYQWTNGNAIIASGSPFPSVTVNGKVCKPSQGNNLYVFPGLGLGVSLAQPDTISDDIILAASARLQDLLSPEDRAEGALYPSLSRIRWVSLEIATAVIEKCQELGVGGKNIPTDRASIQKYVEARMWQPVYGAEGKDNIV